MLLSPPSLRLLGVASCRQLALLLFNFHLDDLATLFVDDILCRDADDDADDDDGG